jgi:hypothetical protein
MALVSYMMGVLVFPQCYTVSHFQPQLRDKIILKSNRFSFTESGCHQFIEVFCFVFFLLASLTSITQCCGLDMNVP